jgi:septum formation protein
MTLTAPFILASGSPRRRSLLEHIGLSFDVIVSPADEAISPGLAPDAVARDLAARKARPVADEHPDALTLAADTIVANEGEILTKPESPDDARRTLRALSGSTHAVYTGMALFRPTDGREVVTGAETEVSFGTIDDREIDAYVETGLPMDKAGAYGIQDPMGSLLVAGIEGDYYNVVGLPLRTLYLTLRREFSDLVEV